MKLQTQISLDKQSNKLVDYNSNILLLGSCFVENIGKKLDYFKFQNLQNPLGILFHPKAIETLVDNAINNKKYNEDDVFYSNEQWHSYNAHSKLSNISKEDLLNDLNKQTLLTNKQLYNATHIIITLGTSWVYRHLETDSIVANCHKIPQKQFRKELLSVEEICQSLNRIVDLINKENDKVAILFTVSPVRHLKDGFIENTQSKAHLISAIHKLLNQKSIIKNHQLFYFPSYEIMMDELRDYRFYTEDMIHPSSIAVDYIWNKFKNSWITTEALKTMEDVDAVQKGLKHKSFNPNSEAHKAFIQKLELKMNKLGVQFPHIIF